MTHRHSLSPARPSRSGAGPLIGDDVSWRCVFAMQATTRRSTARFGNADPVAGTQLCALPAAGAVHVRSTFVVPLALPGVPTHPARQSRGHVSDHPLMPPGRQDADSEVRQNCGEKRDAAHRRRLERRPCPRPPLAHFSPPDRPRWPPSPESVRGLRSGPAKPDRPSQDQDRATHGPA
jgi:hypothetical protein